MDTHTHIHRHTQTQSKKKEKKKAKGGGKTQSTEHQQRETIIKCSYKQVVTKSHQLLLISHKWEGDIQEL